MAWGHSDKEIAERLQLSVKTVETHKANAWLKTKLTGRSDVIRFALLQVSDNQMKCPPVIR